MTLTPATLSASRGRSNGVIEVSPFLTRGGTSKGDMIVTPTTPFSQRAEPSPLWLRTSPKPRIRHGTTRTFRVGCDKAKRGCALRVPPPRPAQRRAVREGCWW